MAKIEIYMMRSCSFCERAEDLLNELGVNFEEIDITDNQDEGLADLEKKTGVATVPQIFVDDKFIGGCDDLYKLHDAGELQALLK